MSTSVSHSRIRTTKFALLTLLAISTFTVAGLRTAAGQESAPACSPVSNIVSPQDVPSGCGCAPPSGGSSIGTGHGSLVKGTVEVTSTISNGWWNTTWRFTSTDLLNIYGYSTLSSAGSFRVGSPWTGARSSVTQKFSATIFVLSQDETPLPTGTETPLSAGTSNAIPVTNITKTSNTMSSTVLANSGNNAASNISFQSTSYNGHIYPQTTYRAVTQPPCAGGGTTYVVEDPINFAYEEDHPLGDIVTHLTASAGWQSASCVSDSYIYDFSASPPGYTVENQQLTKPGGGDTSCFTSGRYHARFWTMADGRIVVGAHHEYFDSGCLCHHVDSYDSPEDQLTTDESGQYTVLSDNFWLGNSGNYNCQLQCIYFDGYASSVPNVVTIYSYPTTDTFPRSHGLSTDQPLPVPWWSPYQSGYEIASTSSSFTYYDYVYLDPGSHYVEEAASGFCPSYCWHTQMSITTIDIVWTAAGDVDRNNHLPLSFSL